MPSWISWGSKIEPKPPTTRLDDLGRNLAHIQAESDDVMKRLHAQFRSLPPQYQAASEIVAVVTITLGGRFIYARHLRRIPNADWVNPSMLKRKRWIKGYVTSVGDADNFRLYHTPGIGWRWPLKFRRIPRGRTALSKETIHIRMAGVDAPELGHFGRPPQPFAQESLIWLKKKVEGKFVYCQLLSKDQYSRVIAVPYLKPRLLPGWLATGRCLSLEMLRAGLATVYQQAGAKYGPGGLKEFLRVEAEAQEAKRGMWIDGTQQETPAEYKRRYREAAADTAAESEAADETETASTEDTGGWLRRLFRLKRRQ